MNSNIVEKIKKLLSLAQSDNANERDAALAKAHAIAVDNQVDMALIDLSTVGAVAEDKLIEDDSTILGKPLDIRAKLLASTIQRFLAVEVIYGYGGSYVNNTRHRTMGFVGRTSEVEYAKWLYSYLADEFVRRWNMERRLHSLPANHRNTFWLGMSRGLSRQIEDAKQAAQQAAFVRHTAEGSTVAETSGRFELALVNEQAARKSFVRAKYPRLGTVRNTRVNITSHDTYSSGVSHGSSMGLNRPLK